MSDELRTSITQAFEYLTTNSIDIPIDLLITARLKGIKAGYISGGVPEINERYEAEIIAALTLYLAGGMVVAPRNQFKSAMVEAFNSSFDTGWVDGGEQLPLDDAAVNWLETRILQEAAFIAVLFEQLKTLRNEPDFDSDAWIAEKAKNYTRTVASVYNAASLLAKKNELLTWHLGQTEKHCFTCASLNNTRHRAAWYVARDYIPRKPGAGMECGGYYCDCSLTDKDGNTITI